MGYIRSKRQARKKTILAKQKQTSQRIFSKRQNAVLDSKATSIQKPQYLKDPIDKTNVLNDRNFFSESETTTPSSIKCRRRIKESFICKSVRFYNWNQPTRNFEKDTITKKTAKKMNQYDKSSTMILYFPLLSLHKVSPLEDKYSFVIIQLQIYSKNEKAYASRSFQK